MTRILDELRMVVSLLLVKLALKLTPRTHPNRHAYKRLLEDAARTLS